MSETKAVSLAALRALVEAGAILNTYIIETDDGRFHVLARSVTGVDHQIAMKRGGLRSFKRLDAAANVLRGLGLCRIHLHLLEFAPGTAPTLR